MVSHHLTIARLAEALDVSWYTANDAVLAEGMSRSTILPASTGSRCWVPMSIADGIPAAAICTSPSIIDLTAQPSWGVAEI